MGKPNACSSLCLLASFRLIRAAIDVWLFAGEWRVIIIRDGDTDALRQAWCVFNRCHYPVRAEAPGSARVFAPVVVIVGVIDVQWRNDWPSAAAAAGGGEMEEDEGFDGGRGESGPLQDGAVPSVRGARLVPLRRQVPVRARLRRTAPSRPPSQIQDGDVPHISHDRLLPVRTSMSLHPQRRRAACRCRRPRRDRIPPRRARFAPVAAGRDRRRDSSGPASAAVLPTSIPICIVRVTHVSYRTGSGPGAAWAADTGTRFDATGTFLFHVPVRRSARLFSFRPPWCPCHRRLNDHRARTLRVGFCVSKSSSGSRHRVVYHSSSKPLLSVLASPTVSRVSRPQRRRLISLPQGMSRCNEQVPSARERRIVCSRHPGRLDAGHQVGSYGMVEWVPADCQVECWLRELDLDRIVRGLRTDTTLIYSDVVFLFAAHRWPSCFAAC